MCKLLRDTDESRVLGPETRQDMISFATLTPSHYADSLTIPGCFSHAALDAPNYHDSCSTH